MTLEEICKLGVRVDPEDYLWLSRYKWRFHTGRSKTLRYVRGYVNGRDIFLHRYIAGAPKGLQVDHKNGDPLDNRRINLEIVTPEENQRRKKK